MSQSQNLTKILIVDDNAGLRMFIRDVIELFYPDCQVWEAHDGHEGLKKVQSAQPDLIFLDYHMPVMNGYEMALALQQLPDKRPIPLVLNTSDDSASPALTYLRKICSATLPKPCTCEEIEQMLGRFIPPQPLGIANEAFT